ncbi:hypothetical protein LCGC14_1102440 [marine sediment metagenome]|uniref:Uncharacterized protein n=1 Tax=marine sediment metagenome TaxID=412755 RepID=A0A0F9QFA2_9ZZZZ
MVHLARIVEYPSGTVVPVEQLSGAGIEEAIYQCQVLLDELKELDTAVCKAEEEENDRECAAMA